MLVITSALRQLAERLRVAGHDRGAVTIEYGVLVVFLALLLIAAAAFMVDGISDWFENIGAFIANQVPGGDG